MVNDILDMMADGRSLPMDEISKHLNLSSAMVEAQIEYLERTGYLQKRVFGEECGGGCTSCSKQCDSKLTGKILFTVWERT